MNKLELYIDSDGYEELNLQRLELFKDEEITITQTIKNNKDISKVFTDYTQDFNVPASKHNKRVFKFVQDSDLVGGINIGKKFKSEIRLNGQTFKKGYIVFRDVVFNNGLPSSYKLYFIGGLGKLKTLLGDTKIGSLDYSDLGVSVLQDFESVKQGLTMDRDDLRAGETDATNPDSYEPLLYSLILAEGGHYYSEDFTQPELKDFPKNLAYRDNTGTASTQPVYGVAYNSIKPSMRMNTIIRAIEKNSLYFGEGKKISFSDDFFNNTSNKQWFDLFLLMHNKKGAIKSTENSGKSIISGWSETTSSIACDSDGISIAFSDKIYNAIDISTGEIVIENNTSPTSFGNGINKITYSFTPTVNDVEYEIFLRNPFDDSDDLLSVTDGKVKGAKDRIVEKPPATFEAINGAEGHLFKLYAKSDSLITINCSITIDWKFTSNPTDAVFETQISLGGQQSIDTNTLMPDIKVIDFLKGAFSLFNLIGYEDSDGTIVVDSYDNYKSSGNTVDITKYVDDKTVNMSLSMLYNNIDFKYKESEFKNYTTRSEATSGSGFTNATLSGENVSVFGSRKVSSSVESADSSFTNSVPFQLMAYSRLKHSTTEASSDNDFDLTTRIQIGELVDFDDQEKDAKGIIYYPISVTQTGATADVNGGLAINDTATTDELNTFNIPSNTLTLHNPAISGSETQSLWFSKEVSAWSGIVCRNGLYENYHFDYVEPFFIPRNRRLKMTAYLPSYLLMTIELKDIIIYKNKEYRINSIKTNLQTGKSSFELEGFVTKDKQIVLPVSKGDSPVITITGDNPITVTYGATYTDAGATATDTEDGNLTGSITDDSASIDTNILSRQIVTYSVTDSDGNTTEAEREVVIEDTSTPSIDTWSINSINQSTGQVDMNFTASSTGSPISRCEFYVKKQGEAEPSSPYETQFTNTGTSTFFGNGGEVYEAWMIAYNGANSTRSSNVTVNILPLI